MRRVVAFWIVLSGCPGVSLDGDLVDHRPPPPPRDAPEPTDPYAAGEPDAGPDVPIDPEDPPPPPPPPCNLHAFTYDDGAATSVWVTGSFTAWATTPAEGALEMQRSGSTWSLAHLVEPEGEHRYKLIVDGTRWIADPSNPDREPDGFGGENSLLSVCTSACGDLDAFDWRDTVMYFVMVDRFRNGDPSNDGPIPGASGTGNAEGGPSGQYEGGDLAGVVEKLPYLSDLGVTALWLSAPYDNKDTLGQGLSDANAYTGYHGYWPKPGDVSFADPMNPTPRPAVEPRIGTEQELRDLVSLAHASDAPGGHGIKVLFDYVMNHVDIESPLYAAHPDWFVHDGAGFRLCGSDCGGHSCWDDPYWTTRCAFTSYLPKLDFENDAARAWSIDDALWWTRTFGADGLRLDAIKHIPLPWLTDLRARLNQELGGERFYLVGETFDYGNRDLLKRFIDPSTMLDGQFDFPLKAELCRDVFRDGGLDALARFMDGNDHYYGPGSLMTTWIGNHDIPRAIHFASGEIDECTRGSNGGNSWTTNFRQVADAAPYERLGVAFAILLTNPGIPLIYYGDEIGLAGGGDPDNRRLMPWGPVSGPQEALRTQVRALARLRAEHKVLSRGRRTTISVDRDTWVYRMSGCGTGAIVVAINRGDSLRTLSLPGAHVDLLAGDQVADAVSVAARSVKVLAPK